MFNKKYVGTKRAYKSGHLENKSDFLKFQTQSESVSIKNEIISNFP